jgi:hypothetical protein
MCVALWAAAVLVRTYAEFDVAVTVTVVVLHAVRKALVSCCDALSACFCPVAVHLVGCRADKCDSCCHSSDGHGTTSLLMLRDPAHYVVPHAIAHQLRKPDLVATT